MSGLLYPGALGMALTWFVLAAYNIATGAPHPPSAQTILFALWFTVYHSLLFARLIDSHQQWPGDPTIPVIGYDGWSFGSDILDTLALFLAFAAFGFQADTEIKPPQMVFVFIAVLIIPYSARVAREKIDRLRWWLVGLVTLVAALGIGLNFFDNSDWNSWLLLGLWLLLGTYWLFAYPED